MGLLWPCSPVELLLGRTGRAVALRQMCRLLRESILCSRLFRICGLSRRGLLLRYSRRISILIRTAWIWSFSPNLIRLRCSRVRWFWGRSLFTHLEIMGSTRARLLNKDQIRSTSWITTSCSLKACKLWKICKSFLRFQQTKMFNNYCKIEANSWCKAVKARLEFLRVLLNSCNQRNLQLICMEIQSILRNRNQRFLLKMLMSRTVTSTSWCLAIIHSLFGRHWRDAVGGLKFNQFILFIISGGNQCLMALGSINCLLGSPSMEKIMGWVHRSQRLMPPWEVDPSLKMKTKTLTKPQLWVSWIIAKW